MKTSEKSTKVAAVVMTALFFTAIAGMIALHDSNTSLVQLLDGSKLKNETLLSERLQAEREVADLRQEMKQYQGKNRELDFMLAQANANLSKKEQELQKARNVKDHSKELAELRKIKAELQNDMAALKSHLRNLEGERNTLNDQLSAANAKNKSLNDKMVMMETMALNNYRIDATTKRENLTVSARRTRNLTMAFDLPQEVASNVQFVVKTPDGQTISQGDKGLAWQEIENSEYLTASLEPVHGNLRITKRIEMNYKPEQKLKKGVFTIDVLDGDKYLASCQVKLK